MKHNRKRVGGSMQRLVRIIHRVSCDAFLFAGGPPNAVNESYDRCPPEVKAAYLAIAKWHLDNSKNDQAARHAQGLI